MTTIRTTALTLATLGAMVASDALAAGGGGPTPMPDQPRPSPSQSRDPKDRDRETEFQKAEYLIKGEKCDEAMPILHRVVADNPRDADAWNYLGFCARTLGKYDEALGYYEKALKLNPKHKGANEYLGELYLKMGNLAKAEQQLAILKGICPNGCEELEDLEADIAEYKAAKPS
jgi:tetratricopeptide (TPR) repeat protein